MGWPKGMKRKKVEEMRRNDFDISTSHVTVTRPFSLLLGVRHLGQSDKFPGLWGLCIVNPDGSETEIIDATTKASVINQAGIAISKCI